MVQKPSEELKEAISIYKIAGVIIAIFFIIGIVVAIVQYQKPSAQPKPQPTQPPAPAPVPIVVQVENITTVVNITATPTPQNISQNATPTPKPSPTAIPVENKTSVVKYSWDAVNITFPSSLQKISPGVSYHYITILEADGTPITNGEQFTISVIVDDSYGHQTQPVATYENQKWLIALRYENKGTYTLTLTISCEGNKGYCIRHYVNGSTQKSINFEVI